MRSTCLHSGEGEEWLDHRSAATELITNELLTFPPFRDQLSVTAERSSFSSLLYSETYLRQPAAQGTECAGPSAHVVFLSRVI